MKILYVEDDPLDADFNSPRIAPFSASIGMDIVSTQDKALTYLRERPGYDLLLTDLNLPIMQDFDCSHISGRKNCHWLSW